MELQKRNEIRDAKNSKKKKIEWGSQIRSYVLAPYRLASDHRDRQTKVDAIDSELHGVPG